MYKMEAKMKINTQAVIEVESEANYGPHTSEYTYYGH